MRRLVSLIYIWIKIKNKAIKCLQKIKLSDNLDLYSKAKYNIAMNCDDLDLAIDQLKMIPEYSELYSDVGYFLKIFKKIEDLQSDELSCLMLCITQNVGNIMEELFVSSLYEESIAHYTNLTVSKLLLTISEPDAFGEYKSCSPLRLNTINLMNDPKEGVLINNLLNLDQKTTTKDLAFISCFTLHHDSLNQFRLYSKEHLKEAFGVSLILNKNFFAQKHNYLNLPNNKKEETNKTFDLKTHKKDYLNPLPLYRCIYIDPTSGLVKVAQREEWSFRREFKKNHKENWTTLNESADRKWEYYKKSIEKIEKYVRLKLENLIALIKKLKLHKDFNKNISKLLAEIILPIRYLMKHFAFKEEQECRIVYVTQIDNPLIQYDKNINRIYINYEPSVMEFLEKIYIAPKAKDEKIIFQYLCSRGQEVRKGKEPVKVKISQNPFR